MNKLVGIVITILIVLSMIPIAISMSDDYNMANTEESFTAVEVLATPEPFTVDHTPTEVTKVTVEGVELTLTTEYTVSGSAITVLANNSETDDVVVVFYSYEMTTSTAQDTLVDLIPTLLIIMLVAGIAISLKMRK